MGTRTTSALVLGSVGTAHSPLHLESSGSLQTPLSHRIRLLLPSMSLVPSVIGPIVLLRMGLLSFLSHLAQVPDSVPEGRGPRLDASAGLTGVPSTVSRRRREPLLDGFLLVRRPSESLSVLAGDSSDHEHPKHIARYLRTTHEQKTRAPLQGLHDGMQTQRCCKALHTASAGQC